MTVTVYDHPLSPYGQKVKIALLEKGVTFNTVMPDAIGSGSATGEFAANSPRGEVPLLLHDGFAVFDSTVILEYIEDAWPDPALLPHGARERARVRMLEDAMDTHFEAINWGLSEIVHFGRASGAEADRIVAEAGEQLQGWFGWLSDQLGERGWFNGSDFGWGDLCVLPYLNGAAGFSFVPAQENLVAWMERANDRSSTRAVTEAAAAVAFGSEAVSLEMVRAALEQGQFKREYRDHRLEWMVKTAGLRIVEEGLASDNIRFTAAFQTGSV